MLVTDPKFQRFAKSRSLSRVQVKENSSNEIFVAFHLKTSNATRDQIRRNWSCNYTKFWTSPQSEFIVSIQFPVSMPQKPQTTCSFPTQLLAWFQWKEAPFIGTRISGSQNKCNKEKLEAFPPKFENNIFYIFSLYCSLCFILWYVSNHSHDCI